MDALRPRPVIASHRHLPVVRNLLWLRTDFFIKRPTYEWRALQPLTRCSSHPLRSLHFGEKLFPIVPLRLSTVGSMDRFRRARPAGRRADAGPS